MRYGAQGARRPKSGQRSRGGGGSGGGGNTRNRVYESNGPEGRVRGTPAQVADKYDGLAKDAASAGDYVLAQSFWQHAEHYRRVLGALDGDGPQQVKAENTSDQESDDQDGDEGNAPGQQQPRQRRPRRPDAQDDDARLPLEDGAQTRAAAQA